MHIFGKRDVIRCAVCGKELGRHKYKPSEEWGIDGLLCGFCHVEKTKEFALAQKNNIETCAMCKKDLADHDQHKPRWQWEMEPGTLLCKSCYEKKDMDYNKRMNFCAMCNAKLGMFFYHPKPAWQIGGNLCRNCWDRQNSSSNDNIRQR